MRLLSATIIVVAVISISSDAYARSVYDPASNCRWDDNSTSGNGDDFTQCCPAGQNPVILDVSTDSGMCVGGNDIPGNSTSPGNDGNGSGGSTGGNGGDSGQGIRHECLRCYGTHENNVRVYRDFNEACQVEAIRRGKRRCEEGRNIRGETVTPAGWQERCTDEIRERPGRPNGEFGNVEVVRVCERHWIDPSGCLFSWLDGVPGMSHTSASFNVGFETPGGFSGGITGPTTTVNYDSYRGLIRACEDMEDALTDQSILDRTICTSTECH